MESTSGIVLHALPHPEPAVRHVGFDLDDPYIERCWVSAIGPTATLLLRRLPDLWRQGEPARVDLVDLGASLGVDGVIDGAHPKIWRTFDRLVRFRMASRVADGELGFYQQVAPLPERLLRQAPPSTRAAHERMLDEHLQRIATGGRGHSPTGPGTARAPSPPTRPPAPARALGR